MDRGHTVDRYYQRLFTAHRCASQDHPSTECLTQTAAGSDKFTAWEESVAGKPFSDLSFVATLRTDDRTCECPALYGFDQHVQIKSSMDIKEVHAKAHICEITLSPSPSLKPPS